MQNRGAAVGREGFREWSAKALKDDAGIAHKYTTQTPKAPLLPGTTQNAKTHYLILRTKYGITPDSGTNHGGETGRTLPKYMMILSRFAKMQDYRRTFWIQLIRMA